jgi:hypothetical protein
MMQRIKTIDLLLSQLARFRYIVTPPSLGKVKLTLNLYMQRWIGGWVGPEASPDAEQKRNLFSSENRTLIHRSSSLQFSQYTDRAMPPLPVSLHEESERIPSTGEAEFEERGEQVTANTEKIQLFQYSLFKQKLEE